MFSCWRLSIIWVKLWFLLFQFYLKLKLLKQRFSLRRMQEANRGFTKLKKTTLKRNSFGQNFWFRNTVKAVLTANSGQRPPVNNGHSEGITTSLSITYHGSFSDNPLYNDHIFQVPRVAVVHRFDCTQKGDVSGLWLQF